MYLYEIVWGRLIGVIGVDTWSFDCSSYKIASASSKSNMVFPKPLPDPHISHIRST